MAKLGINLGYLLFQIFNFTVMCILLYAWAYKPILKMLDNRKRKLLKGWRMPGLLVKLGRMRNKKPPG